MPEKNIDDKFVDEPMPCVYGPPSWYNSNGTFDRSNPEVKEFLNEIEEIKERNRKRKEMHDRMQEMVDKPIEKVYGPKPHEEGKGVKPEFIDRPVALVYGPDPSFISHKDDDEEKRQEEMESGVATKIKAFFSRLIGRLHRNSRQ